MIKGIVIGKAVLPDVVIQREALAASISSGVSSSTRLARSRAIMRRWAELLPGNRTVTEATI